VIFGAIYKSLHFGSRVEDSFYREVLGRFLGFTVLPSVKKRPLFLLVQPSALLQSLQCSPNGAEAAWPAAGGQNPANR
jgi:hypothetical protein